MIIFLTILVWFSIGVLSIGFWWTREFDLTMGELPLLIAGGILGPGAFPLGLLLHYYGNTEKVIWRKKVSKNGN